MLSMQLSNGLRRFGFVLLAMTLTACATSKTPDLNAMAKLAGVDSTIDSAIAVATSDKDRALAMLDAAAKAFPEDTKPWLKSAQINFDSGDYPNAILAAEEVIKHDPGNTEAQGIALVASMRIAVKYVAAMQSLGQEAGSVRADAEQLAKKLRKAVGEQVLVPTTTARRPEASEAPRQARRPALPSAFNAPSRSASAEISLPQSASPSTGNPFGALQ